MYQGFWFHRMKVLNTSWHLQGPAHGMSSCVIWLGTSPMQHWKKRIRNSAQPPLSKNTKDQNLTPQSSTFTKANLCYASTCLKASSFCSLVACLKCICTSRCLFLHFQKGNNLCGFLNRKISLSKMEQILSFQTDPHWEWREAKMTMAELLPLKVCIFTSK